MAEIELSLPCQYILCLFCLFCKFPLFSCSNLTTSPTSWSSARATWYGSRDGAGSSGGSCGYGNAVSTPPFSSLVTGVGPSLYQSGRQCGVCYQVRCTTNRWCSKKATRVVITDFCPGGICASGPAHFDLSGTAFGAMSLAGREDSLRDAGIIEVEYARVACDYGEKRIAFRVDEGSNSHYFATSIMFQEGDGDLSGVDLMESHSRGWKGMVQSWGSVWKIDSPSELRPPFSIRLTSGYSKQTLVAKNVIPRRWVPGFTYKSMVNYL